MKKFADTKSMLINSKSVKNKDEGREDVKKIMEKKR